MPAEDAASITPRLCEIGITAHDITKTPSHQHLPPHLEREARFAFFLKYRSKTPKNTVFSAGTQSAMHGVQSHHQPPFFKENTMHDFSSISQAPVGNYETEFENEFENEFETYELETEFEANEFELATQLLGVTNEMEMEQFLGDVFKTIGHAAKSVINSPVGKALGGVLKSAAKTALPMVGSALGNMVLPGVGGALGGQLASMAGGAMGLELEALSNEDRELEVAQRLVRVARQAAQNVAHTPIFVAPEQAARAAFGHALRQAAPEVLRIPEIVRVVRQVTAGVPATAPVLPTARASSPAAAIARAPVGRPQHHQYRHHAAGVAVQGYGTGAPTYGSAGGATPTYGSAGAVAPTYGTAGGATPTYGSAGAIAHHRAGSPAHHAGYGVRPGCGQCNGTSVLPLAGSWRLTRSGRAIVLFVDGR
jgi:hypothetical protein